MEQLLSLVDRCTRSSKTLNRILNRVERRLALSAIASACTGDDLCSCGYSGCQPDGYNYLVCSEYWFVPNPLPPSGCYPRCTVQIPC